MARVAEAKQSEGLSSAAKTQTPAASTKHTEEPPLRWLFCVSAAVTAEPAPAGKGRPFCICWSGRKTKCAPERRGWPPTQDQFSSDTLKVMVFATKSTSPDTILITPSDTISKEYI